jgi:hypothetical protein
MERTLGRRREERAALKERAAELRDRLAARLAIVEPETYIPTPIPSFGTRLAELPARRRRAFRRDLIRLIRQADNHDVASSAVESGLPPTPEVKAVLNGACSLCRGFCCSNGSDHAYLVARTIHRFRTRFPGLAPRDVVTAYADHLGHETVDGSCIFHGPAGCRLPREMRSDTCNDYFCPELVDFWGESEGRGPLRGFFVTSVMNQIQSAAFCNKDGSTVEQPIQP